MKYEKDKVIQEIRSLLKSLKKAHIIVNAAYLFGSYAKGTQRKWSDVDIAVISDDFCGVSFYDFKKLIPLIRNYSSFIEVHPFRIEDFNPDDDLFVREIMETGIRIK